MTTKTEPVIVGEGINFAFGQGELRKQILFDVELEIQPGEIVLLTGPSGSGKTAGLGARPDCHPANRGAGLRPEEGVHDRDRDPQHAAGGSCLRPHRVLLAWTAGGIRPHG